MIRLTQHNVKSLVSCSRVENDLGWIVVWILSAFVLVVSLNDVYWSFKTQDVLYEFERNPIGRWLIELDGGDIALFMTMKMIGTMLVVAALPLFYLLRKRIGMIIALAVGKFQLLLFLYLNFGNVLPIFDWL